MTYECQKRSPRLDDHSPESVEGIFQLRENGGCAEKQQPGAEDRVIGQRRISSIAPSSIQSEAASFNKDGKPRGRIRATRAH